MASTKTQQTGSEASDNKRLEMAVQKLAGTFQKDIVSIFVCNVTAVNEEERTCDCTPISGDAATPIPGVQLMAEVNDGFLILPKIDSTVIVALSTRNTAFVLMYSDIDKVKLITNLTQFNDGSFGGLTKIEILTARIQRLENMMNTHIHAGVTTGAGVSGVSSTPIEPVTTRSDLENTKITHG